LIIYNQGKGKEILIEYKLNCSKGQKEVLYMNKTVFCAECRKDVNFVTKETEFKRTLKDNEYSFIGLEAYCAECGSPIYVSEIEDNNLSLLYNIYSKEKRSVANASKNKR